MKIKKIYLEKKTNKIPIQTSNKITVIYHQIKKNIKVNKLPIQIKTIPRINSSIKIMKT